MSRLQSFAIVAVALVTLALGIAWWTGRSADDVAAGDAPSAATSTEAPAGDAPSAATSTEAPAGDAPTASTAANAAQSDAPAAASPADVAAQGEDDGTAEAEGADAPPPVEPEAPADVAVPDGYAAVAPLVAERQVAFEAADEVLDPALDYAAVIETNRGTLVVDLFEAETPVTVNNFVFLALHRYYDGIVFHRVIDGFMAQTGDPTGTGTGGPGYRFADEVVDGLVHDAPGVLSMANAGPGTNGSQFFLTFDATPWLDGAHTVFGRVTEGLEVLDAITRVDPQQPSVVALLSDPVADVRAQGIDLAGDGTVEEALTEALGAAPVPGPGFEIAGARVAIGSVDGAPAAGFFPFPDRMERVTIVARTRD